MTKMSRRSLASLAAVGIVLGGATACSDDAAEAAGAGSKSATPSGSGSGSSSGSASASGTPGAASSSATPAGTGAAATPSATATTEDPQYVDLPAPGSTWSPPKVTAEQLKGNEELRKAGFKVAYVDPAIALAAPKREPIQPQIAEADLTRDDVGALRIVDFYYNSIDYLVLSNDAEPLRGVTSLDFEYGKSLQRQASEWKKNGAYVTSDPIYVENLTILERSENAMKLEGKVNLPEINAYYKANSLLVTSPSESGVWIFDLTWGEHDYWIISDASKKS